MTSFPDPARFARLCLAAALFATAMSTGASAADKDFISSYYLPWLKAHPESWYTSDGDPAKVSFPKAYADVLAPTYKGEANPY